MIPDAVGSISCGHVLRSLNALTRSATGHGLGPGIPTAFAPPGVLRSRVDASSAAGKSAAGAYMGAWPCCRSSNDFSAGISGRGASEPKMRSAIVVERTDLQAITAGSWGVGDARYKDVQSEALAGRRGCGRARRFCPADSRLGRTRTGAARPWTSQWLRFGPATRRRAEPSALRAGVADTGEIAFSTRCAGSGELCDTLF